MSNRRGMGTLDAPESQSACAWFLLRFFAFRKRVLAGLGAGQVRSRSRGRSARRGACGRPGDCAPCGRRRRARGVLLAKAPPPRFDIVSVEPSGAAVIAGRVLPDGKVALMSGGEVLAEGSADSAGLFVLQLHPLVPGDYTLKLRMRPRAGDSASSVRDSGSRAGWRSASISTMLRFPRLQRAPMAGGHRSSPGSFRPAVTPCAPTRSIKPAGRSSRARKFRSSSPPPRRRRMLEPHVARRRRCGRPSRDGGGAAGGRPLADQPENSRQRPSLHGNLRRQFGANTRSAQDLSGSGLRHAERPWSMTQ